LDFKFKIVIMLIIYMIVKDEIYCVYVISFISYRNASILIKNKKECNFNVVRELVSVKKNIMIICIGEKGKDHPEQCEFFSYNKYIYVL
jgi:hypothetical protein